MSTPGELRCHAPDAPYRARRSTSPAHQRKSFWVKLLIGASSVVCPCIAVMGLVPAACNRVGETTGGAAHDVRRDHGVSQCRGGLAPTASLGSRLVRQAATGA